MQYHPMNDSGGLPDTVYGHSAGSPPPTSALDGSATVDVAVVGAGFTGLSAALHAAEAGSHVAVLEANEIGWGASGRNFGQVVPYLRHEAPHALRSFGPDYGERLVSAAASGPDLLFGLIERHGIECQATRKGLIFAAHAQNALVDLAKRSEFWEKRGTHLPLLNRSETAEIIGGGSYPGALLEPRGGTINPLAYARGLAAAAMASGTTIYTRSRATRISRNGSGWRIETAAGSLQAEAVVIATNAYSDDLWSGLKRTIVAMRAYQLASRPLRDDLRRSILPGGQPLTDTRRMTSGVRLHHDGRLHISADGPHFSRTEAPLMEAAVDRVTKLFPQLPRIEWEFSWSGWLAITPDEYPRLLELAPSVFAALGYSGRGVALGTVLGREIARRVAGAAADTLVLPITSPRAVGLPVLNHFAVRTVVGYKKIRDALDLRWMQ